MSEVQQYSSKKEASGVQLSEAAKRHLLTYLAKKSSRGVRFSVKKTGCSGLSYVIDYVDSPNPDDFIQKISEDYLICIDRKSYPYLKGLLVDYVTQGLNSKFKFENPNQTGQCGCGESFTVE